MTHKIFFRALFVNLLLVTFVVASLAQSGSTRPRRVTESGTGTPAANTSTSPADSDNLPAQRTATSASPASNSSNAASRATNAAATGNVGRAYSLLQQKQYAAAAREAKQLTAVDPNNAEAWKIAGFAEVSLQQYADAAIDLQKALDLQRAAKTDDPNTIDALAQALVRTEAFDRALPLLIAATTRAGARPDAGMLYLRGISEYRTGKAADAERSFNAAVRANPKDAASLFYLGRIAYERNDYDKAVAMLNRATLASPTEPIAWSLLTSSYLQRAALTAANDDATSTTRANADYTAAARAGETLFRLKPDTNSALVYGQALLSAKRYAPAAVVLERAAANNDAPATTFYLLGIAYSRAKNYPKAISTLEQAAQKTPDDVNIYRELGYDYEISKQYGKALAVYQKGANLAPSDADFKTSIERVRPYAK